MDLLIFMLIFGAASAPGMYYVGRMIEHLPLAFGLWLIFLVIIASHVGAALEVYGG